MATKTAIAKDGIFIPRELLPIGREWEIIFRGLEIVMRPNLSSRLAAR